MAAVRRQLGRHCRLDRSPVDGGGAGVRGASDAGDVLLQLCTRRGPSEADVRRADGVVIPLRNGPRAVASVPRCCAVAVGLADARWRMDNLAGVSSAGASAALLLAPVAR